MVLSDLVEIFHFTTIHLRLKEISELISENLRCLLNMFFALWDILDGVDEDRKGEL